MFTKKASFFFVLDIDTVERGIQIPVPYTLLYEDEVFWAPYSKATCPEVKWSSHAARPVTESKKVF